MYIIVQYFIGVRVYILAQHMSIYTSCSSSYIGMAVFFYIFGMHQDQYFITTSKIFWLNTFYRRRSYKMILSTFFFKYYDRQIIVSFLWLQSLIIQQYFYIYLKQEQNRMICKAVMFEQSDFSNMDSIFVFIID